MPKVITRDRIAQIRRYIDRRNAFYSFLQNTLHRIKSFDQLFVIIFAMIIGIITGYLAVGFRTLIALFRDWFWGPGALVEVVRLAPTLIKIAIPTVGMVAIALFVFKFAWEARGHGVPEVIDAVATKNGFIRIRVVLVKALASAVSIASGAAVGREGPIVQIGSAFGSSVGQFFQVSTRRMKTFIGCGAAAGIAATFNAPIAGALFASEIILGDFSVTAIGPLIISSVFGTVISRSFYGDYPAFIPPPYHFLSASEIPFYIILGICCGLVGLLFVRSLYFFEDVFDNWKIPVGVKALTGGLILGIMALFVPEVLGVGYESMSRALTGHISILLAILLLFGKIFATSISLSSGASGGIFAPSLFMGALLGDALGLIFHSLYPEVTASYGAYSLVGMAGLGGGASHDPPFSTIIIFRKNVSNLLIFR